MIEKGTRVCRPGSWYVGTIVNHSPDSDCVLVEYDAHGRYAEGKRTEVCFINRSFGVVKASPVNEYHNACGMQDEGVPTVIPENPYDPTTNRLKREKR